MQCISISSSSTSSNPAGNPIRPDCWPHDAGYVYGATETISASTIPISGCGVDAKILICACAGYCLQTLHKHVKILTAAGRFQMKSTTCYSQKSAIKMCITDTLSFFLFAVVVHIGKRGLCNR